LKPNKHQSVANRMKNPPLLNLVISDPHCGSDVGLMPPSVILENGTERGHGNNKKLKWIWQSFLAATANALEVINGDPFILTFNGDIIEGIHHRSDEVVAAKIIEHVGIAAECFSTLVGQASKTLVTKGTECHVRDMETVFMRELNIPGKAMDVQQYEINGCLVDARHHMPATSRLHLEASGLGVVMANCRSNMLRAGHSVPKVFLRAHRHCGGDYCDGESMILVTPPWQMLTRHAHKVVTDAIPRVGMYLLDWRNVPKGGLPATHRFFYAPPLNVLHT